MVTKTPFKNFEEKLEYLNNLYYEVGQQESDFELCYMDKKKDINSKWRKWSVIGFDNENKENRKWITIGNNRTILKNEVVLDLEEPDRYDEILKRLEDQGLSFRVFKTGSKGYHFHLLFRGEVLPEDKLKIIECFDCDTQKASGRCMIAMEFEKHWKTGRHKELIKTGGDGFNNVMEILSKNNYEEEESLMEEKDRDSGKPVLGIGRFNKATHVFAPRESLVYQNETTGTQEDSFFVKTTYSIYLVMVGAGNKPRFVFCDPNQKIEIGESSVYLKPLENEGVSRIVDDLTAAGCLVEFVEKKAKIKTYKKDCTIEDYKEAVVRSHDKSPLFFRKTLPLPIEVLAGIKDYYKFIKDLLNQNIKLDEHLVDMYISKIPEFNSKKIKAKTAMPFSNNGLIITNAGVGKTSLANAITGEPTITDCSAANLLGFSTADKKIPGKLDKRTKPIVIEELQEFKEDEVLGQLLTYHEQGSCERAKGLGIKCEGYSEVIYQGNPKVRLNDDVNMAEFLMAKAFRDFVGKISSNLEAFGRRVGDIEIGLDYAAVTGVGIDEDARDKTSQIIRAISEGFSEDFSVFMKKKLVFNWLNKCHDDEHIEKINKLILKCNDKLILKFFEGQRLNYRHLRGGAIKRAWLQLGISKIFDSDFNDKDVLEVLECADIHLEYRKARNIRSLANILSLVGNPEYNKIIQQDLKGIKPEYLKILIFSLFRNKVKGCDDKIVPLSNLETHFTHIRDSWKVEGKYQYFSRLKEPFEKHLSQFGNIFEILGIDYDKPSSAFIISDPQIFEGQIKLYKEIIGIGETEGTEGTTGTEGTEGTEGTVKIEEKKKKDKKINDDCTLDCTFVPIVPPVYKDNKNIGELIENLTDEKCKELGYKSKKEYLELMGVDNERHY